MAAPLTLRHGTPWPNRLALAPLTNQQSNADGSLSPDEQRWLLRRADGGFGLIMTAAAYVTPAGRVWSGQLGIHDDAMVPGLSRLAAALRAKGAASSVQLHHGGRRANPIASGCEPVAPWDDPSRGVRALTQAEIGRVVEDFVQAAVRAERSGFDGVEIHGAHGYLLGQFLDVRNARGDGYGGSFEDRARIVREIVSGVRSATGHGFQLGLRISPERHGIVLSEARELAQWAMSSGLLDYLDVSLWNVFKQPDEQQYVGTLLIEHFAQLDRHGCRLTVAGKIAGASDVRWCQQRCIDAVFVGTGAVLHHDFARRTLADAQFRAVQQPVTRAHLAAESVGPRFINYLAAEWDDFVV